MFVLPWILALSTSTVYSPVPTAHEHLLSLLQWNNLELVLCMSTARRPHICLDVFSLTIKLLAHCLVSEWIGCFISCHSVSLMTSLPGWWVTGGSCACSRCLRTGMITKYGATWIEENMMFSPCHVSPKTLGTIHPIKKQLHCCLRKPSGMLGSTWVHLCLQT